MTLPLPCLPGLQHWITLQEEKLKQSRLAEVRRPRRVGRLRWLEFSGQDISEEEGMQIKHSENQHTDPLVSIAER